jgi:hypothetical protein
MNFQSTKICQNIRRNTSNLLVCVCVTWLLHFNNRAISHFNVLLKISPKEPRTCICTAFYLNISYNNIRNDSVTLKTHLAESKGFSLLVRPTAFLISNQKSKFLWASLLALDPFAPFQWRDMRPFPNGRYLYFLLYIIYIYDCDDDEVGGMNGFGRGNRSTRKKPAPTSLCPPQIPLARPRREHGPSRWEAWD